MIELLHGVFEPSGCSMAEKAMPQARELALKEIVASGQLNLAKESPEDGEVETVDLPEPVSLGTITFGGCTI